MQTSPISQSAAASELLWRRAARRSLIEFTRYTKRDFQVGAHHALIGNALDRVVRGECKRLILCAPPRHTKSETSSRRLPALYLGQNPSHDVMFTTYAAEFAEEFGRDVRQIVASREYRALFPQVVLSEDSQAKGHWRTKQEGSYYAVGVGGPITGRGAHLALIDDPHKNRQEADSEAIQDAIWAWYTSTLRPRLMPGGAIVLTCTRWNERDLAGRLIAASLDGTGEKWECVILPAITVEGGKEVALWPEWFPLDELKRLRGVLGPRDWLSLYQQTPTLGEGLQFKREHAQWESTSPRRDLLNVYITGDFAISENRDSDFTEFGVFGVDAQDQVHVLDWWYGQESSDVWVERLVDLIERWKPLRFVGEAGMIRKAVEPWLLKRMRERRVMAPCEWLASIVDKKARASSFEGLWATRRVSWLRTDWAERVVDQLLRFPAGSLDDAVDACTLFGRYLASVWAASRKPQERTEAERQALLAAQQKQFEAAWSAPQTIGSLRPKRRAA